MIEPRLLLTFNRPGDFDENHGHDHDRVEMNETSAVSRYTAHHGVDGCGLGLDLCDCLYPHPGPVDDLYHALAHDPDETDRLFDHHHRHHTASVGRNGDHQRSSDPDAKTHSSDQTVPHRHRHVCGNHDRDPCRARSSPSCDPVFRATGPWQAGS